MFDQQSPTVARKLPSVQDAAEDIRRLTAALEARRQVAPDNLVELAALAVDLQRASAVWRRLVPSGLLELGRLLSDADGRGQRTSTVGGG